MYFVDRAALSTERAMESAGLDGVVLDRVADLLEQKRRATVLVDCIEQRHKAGEGNRPEK